MLDEVFDPFLTQLLVLAPIFVLLALVLIVLAAPMPGRGPRLLQGRNTQDLSAA